jgi:hypothetical protein
MLNLKRFIVMKNLRKLFVILFIANFIACSNDLVDEMSVFTEDDSVSIVFKVSEEEAKETLMSFLDQFDSNPSSGLRSRSQRTIKDVQAYNLNPATRSSSDYDYEIPDDVETLFYVINFDDDQGFGIVSGDKRTTPVLAVIDEGALSLDSLSSVENTGFLMFLDQAAEMQVRELERFAVVDDGIVDGGGSGGSGGGGGSSPTVILDLPVRLKTKWSQSEPYNKFAPNGITGCVMTAAAQALSFFQTIGGVQWQCNNSSGASMLNWSQIMADCQDSNGGYGKLLNSTVYHLQSALQVSHLMRFLGVACNADYQSNGTGADTGDAVKYLKKWCGLSSSTDLCDYDATGVRKALTQNPNCLIMARSYANRTNRFLGLIYTYEDGHAWIIDGLRRIRYGTSTTDYVHCNWGWGGQCDGYFVSGSFNTKEDPVFLDSHDENIATNEYNFRYKKQYAVLSR